jgi:outer membrane protein assembly factor BamE (lipoprotein component of BamABCDE complex)
MNPLRLFIFAATLAAAGCATNLPPEIATRLNQASAQYAGISRGMDRAHVVARVGEPQSYDDFGRARWREEAGPDVFEALIVDFDAAGKATFVETIRSRVDDGHGVENVSRDVRKSGVDVAELSRKSPVAAASVPPIYHDYDYRMDGTVPPYPARSRP